MSLPDNLVRVKVFAHTFERGIEILAAKLTGEDGYQGVEPPGSHKGNELIKPLKMELADNRWIGLEIGPDEQDTEVISTQSSELIQIAFDR